MELHATWVKVWPAGCVLRRGWRRPVPHLIGSGDLSIDTFKCWETWLRVFLSAQFTCVRPSACGVWVARGAPFILCQWQRGRSQRITASAAVSVDCCRAYMQQEAVLKWCQAARPDLSKTT